MDPEQYFEEVIAGVSNKWADLARKLGFSGNEIKVIRTDEPNQDRRCREVLHRWRNREGRRATVQVLKQALIDIDERRTAENLEGETESDDSSTEDTDVEGKWPNVLSGDGIGARSSSRKRRASQTPVVDHQKMSKQQRQKGLKRLQAGHGARPRSTKKKSRTTGETESDDSSTEDSDVEEKWPNVRSGGGIWARSSSRKRRASPPPAVGHQKRKKQQRTGPKRRLASFGAGPSRTKKGSGVGGFRRKPVVLMLNDEYGTAKGGISTIHRQMGRFLVSKGAKVYSTVLKATPQDKDDAEADEVNLIFPTRRKGDPNEPSLDWLTWEHRSRYPDLPDVDFIVGHVSITSRAARLIKEDRLHHAKLVQVTHVIPEDVARHKSEERELRIQEEKRSIREDLKAADVIVSVGPRLFDYYQKETGGKIRHEVFLPEPSDIFKNAEVKYVDTKTKVVLSIGRVKGVERLKGYDLTGKSMVNVMEQWPDTIWRVCGISPDDFSESKAIIQGNIRGKIHFTPLQYCTQKELREEMGRADVVLMPSRAEPFGLVGLEAIAAGVPVLVSHMSGLAWFLETQDPEFDRTIVEIDYDDDEAVKTLSKRIIKILKDGPKEFKAAQGLRKKLLESNYWADSHANFLEIFGL